MCQQSRIRQKEDFINAFSPVVAEATAATYKGATSDIQSKLRRVVEVWRDRTIFDPAIQGAIESRLDGMYRCRVLAHNRELTFSLELDKSRGTSKPGFGSSPFGGSSVPADIAPLVSAHQAAGKLSIPLKATVISADQEYEKQTDPSNPVPSAPVYAARLNGLLTTLAGAESKVADCIKAREGLVTGLEKLLETSRAALDKDRDVATRLGNRKREIEEKKQQVEMGIMQALGSTDNNGSPAEAGSVSPPAEPDRPEMEALTPPTMEAFTPPDTTEEPYEMVEHIKHEQGDTKQGPGASGIEMLSDVASSYQSLPVAINGSNKRRRVDDSGDFPVLEADGDIDADVAAMLMKDEAA